MFSVSDSVQLIRPKDSFFEMNHLRREQHVLTVFTSWGYIRRLRPLLFLCCCPTPTCVTRLHCCRHFLIFSPKTLFFHGWIFTKNDVFPSHARTLSSLFPSTAHKQVLENCNADIWHVWVAFEQTVVLTQDVDSSQRQVNPLRCKRCGNRQIWTCDCCDCDCCLQLFSNLLLGGSATVFYCRCLAADVNWVLCSPGSSGHSPDSSCLHSDVASVTECPLLVVSGSRNRWLSDENSDNATIYTSTQHSALIGLLSKKSVLVCLLPLPRRLHLSAC